MEKIFFRLRNIETGEVVKDEEIYNDPAMFFNGDIIMNDSLHWISHEMRPEFNTFKRDKFGQEIFQHDMTNFGKIVFEDAGFKFEGGDYIGLTDSNEIEILK